MNDIDFPEWISIIDTNETIKPSLGGGYDNDSDNMNTEDLQVEIKKLFQEIESQSGGKKKGSKKRTSKKKSSKRKSKSSRRKSSKSAGPLDNYNIALNHIASVMKLGKSVKDRAPAREIIKKIQKIIDQSLTGEAKYKEINKVFDADPKKYM
jgi:hypothetical protein